MGTMRNLLKRASLVLGLVASFVLLALPAMAETTTTFNAEAEVSSFLSTVISAGWPIFLAIVGGLLAVTLASGGVRAIMRKAKGLFTKAS